MSKLLKILFVILLVVTVAEAGYYVYVLKVNSTSKSAQVLQTRQSTQEQSTPTSVTVSPAATDPYIDTFLNTQSIQYMRNFGRRDNQSLYLSFEQTGWVKNIHNATTTDTSAGFTLVDESDTKIITLVHTPTLKYIKVNGLTRTPIVFSDIKEGYKIILRYQDDLLNPGVNESEILVYEK